MPTNLEDSFDSWLGDYFPFLQNIRKGAPGEDDTSGLSNLETLQEFLLSERTMRFEQMEMDHKAKCLASFREKTTRRQGQGAQELQKLLASEKALTFNHNEWFRREWEENEELWQCKDFTIRCAKVKAGQMGEYTRRARMQKRAQKQQQPLSKDPLSEDAELENKKVKVKSAVAATAGRVAGLLGREKPPTVSAVAAEEDILSKKADIDKKVEQKSDTKFVKPSPSLSATASPVAVRSSPRLSPSASPSPDSQKVKRHKSKVNAVLDDLQDCIITGDAKRIRVPTERLDLKHPPRKAKAADKVERKLRRRLR